MWTRQIKNDCRNYYLSLCFGQKYPDERMLRERMFGSMMVSSASGLFRIRPETSRWGRKNLLKCFFKEKQTKKPLCLKLLLNYSPMTSSFTSFHSKSFPASWAIVTVILLWMPCATQTGRKSVCQLSLEVHSFMCFSFHTFTWLNKPKESTFPNLSIQDEGLHKVWPDVRGTCRGRASHLCGRQQQGCSWKEGN